MKTYGLTHLGLAVRDPEASARFYGRVFGARVTYRDEATVEVQTPGRKDVLSFTRRPRAAGKPGGVEHFGFRLTRPGDIDAAVRAAEAAGGRVRERGAFGPGRPYAYVVDPDGYEVEIWYE